MEHGENTPNGRTITISKLEKVPCIAEQCWQVMKDVSKAKLFAACMELSKDESEIRVERTFDWQERGNWTELEEHVCAIEQNVRWLIVNVPYLTDNMGKRNKVVFITWVPDSITRPSMRESVRIKFNGVNHGGPMRQQAAIDGVAMYQANDASDMSLWSVFEKVARFERDGVDKESVTKLLKTEA